jgi:hypothetical protein
MSCSVSGGCEKFVRESDRELVYGFLQQYNCKDEFATSRCLQACPIIIVNRVFIFILAGYKINY